MRIGFVVAVTNSVVARVINHWFKGNMAEVSLTAPENLHSPHNRCTYNKSNTSNNTQIMMSQ